MRSRASSELALFKAQIITKNQFSIQPKRCESVHVSRKAEESQDT